MFPGLVLNMFHSQHLWLGVCDWVSLLSLYLSLGSALRFVEHLGHLMCLVQAGPQERKKTGPWVGGVGGHREEEEIVPGDMGGGGQGSGLSRTLTG